MSERRGNRLPQSVYRRRRVIAGLAFLGIGAGTGVGTALAVDAYQHRNDPIPAGCEVMIPSGGTVYGSIAGPIAASTEVRLDAQGVMDNLERTNPGEDLARVEQWQIIGIPEQYCDGPVQQLQVEQ